MEVWNGGGKRDSGREMQRVSMRDKGNWLNGQLERVRHVHITKENLFISDPPPCSF